MVWAIKSTLIHLSVRSRAMADRLSPTRRSRIVRRLIEARIWVQTAIRPARISAAVYGPSLTMPRSLRHQVAIGATSAQWNFRLRAASERCFSRKTHGASGTFDIDLPLTGVVGVECRSGGATNDYQVVVTFASPVTFSSAAVNDGAGAVESTSGNGTNTVTVNLTSVTNASGSPSRCLASPMA